MNFAVVLVTVLGVFGGIIALLEYFLGCEHEERDDNGVCPDCGDGYVTMNVK